jgi:hypothetical protein
VRLDQVARKFSKDMNFLCVYIREAHPADGSQSPKNVDEDIIFNKPTTDDERAHIAGACMLRYNYSFPMVLDDMEDTVDTKYMAGPVRLYVLDADGRIIWKSGLGPHYLDADGYEAAVEQAVSA